VDLRHTRTFVTVAELGTVSKAALRLRIAQPALSRQLSDLEHELGFKLFDRVGRRLLLTSEGEQLLNDCRGLLSYASALGERAQLLRRGDTGVLKVAASPQHIESVFAQLLLRYAERFPKVEVRVSEGGSAKLLALLERGDVHLALNMLHGIQLDEQRFGSHPLEPPVELLAACHPQQTLGNRGAIDVARLAPYPLLLLDSGFGFRRAFDAACRLSGLKPNILFESRIPQTLLALAEAGHGVAIIPSALRTHRYALRIANVTYGGEPLREPLTILWDKRRPLPGFATAFRDMWVEHVREVFPITRPTKPDTGTNAKRTKRRNTTAT
jgi:DNA-binding transcriptional LysR family regulator